MSDTTDSLDSQKHNHRRILEENFDLLLENQEVILSHPHFRRVKTPAAGLSLAYISGSGMLPLCVLFSLWRRREFIGVCPLCSGQAYLFFLAGSILSGNNFWWGICGDCGKASESKFVPGPRYFFDYVTPVFEERSRWQDESEPGDPICLESGFSLASGPEMLISLNIGGPPKISRSVEKSRPQLEELISYLKGFSKN